MSIYDVRLYGAYFQYKLEFFGVNICAKKEDVYKVPGLPTSFFEITVLKEYEGKEDVLKIEFANGEVAYETLNSPFLYMDMDDNVWRKSNDTSMPEDFMKVYLSMQQ